MGKSGEFYIASAISKHTLSTAMVEIVIDKLRACLFITPLSSSRMFIGEYSHNLDDKGRLAVPKKFRTALSKGAVVTRGLDNCLFLYTKDEWKKLADKLANLPFSQANARAFARLMLAGAMDVVLDKQGRIILPEYLRTFAGLDKELIVAGLYNRLELWDKTAWTTYTTQSEKQSNTIAEQMFDLGV